MWNTWRTVAFLSICQGLASSFLTLTLFSSSLIALTMVDQTWATLPLALMVVATALSIYPINRLMEIYGRKSIFITSQFALALSSALVAYSIRSASFVIFSLALIIAGSCLAVIQQFRFCAMESVDSSRHSKAVALVLLGGILAAIIGPQLAVLAKDSTATAFEGSFWLAAILPLLCIVVLSRLHFPNIEHSEQQDKTNTNIRDFLRRPTFVAAIAASAVAWGVMSFLMTATPISMHEHHGFSLTITKVTIQAHILAMYLPSLVSGTLVARLGLTKIYVLGVGLFVMAIATALASESTTAFMVALILLGVAWNILFVAGTSMLSHSYRANERFRAQGIHDTAVFTVQAIASLSSGILLASIGWQALLWLSIPVAILPLVALWRMKTSDIKAYDANSSD